MQPEAAEAFQNFLTEVRADENIPEFSFSEVFRSQKKQAHFSAIKVGEDTVELDKHSIKGGVNPPGMSFHKVGLAFDANVRAISLKNPAAVKTIEQIANKRGFYRTVANESWHFGYVGLNPPTDLKLEEKSIREYVASSLGYFSWSSMYSQAQFLFQNSRYDDYVCPFGNDNYGDQ